MTNYQGHRGQNKMPPNFLKYMPPFGFGRKEQPQSFTTDITDKEDLEEI